MKIPSIFATHANTLAIDFDVRSIDKLALIDFDSDDCNINVQFKNIQWPICYQTTLIGRKLHQPRRAHNTFESIANFMQLVRAADDDDDDAYLNSTDLMSIYCINWR